METEADLLRDFLLELVKKNELVQQHVQNPTRGRVIQPSEDGYLVRSFPDLFPTSQGTPGTSGYDLENLIKGHVHISNYLLRFKSERFAQNYRF